MAWQWAAMGDSNYRPQRYENACKQFVRLALQDSLNQYNIPMHIEVSAA